MRVLRLYPVSILFVLLAGFFFPATSLNAEPLRYVNAPQGRMPGDSPNQKIINGGVLASSTSSVVQIRGKDSNGAFICTGSIIAPKVVLTASHCLARSPSLMTVVIAGRIFKVARFKAPPNIRYDQSGLIHNDIALLFLERPTSQPRLSLLVSRKPRPGDTIQISGYGLDEYGDIGFLQGGNSTISRVNSEFLITIFSSLAQANSCSGDSGGPAILAYTDGQGRTRTGIVGTVSAGTSSRCWIGDRTYFVNLQSQFIFKFLTSQVRNLRTE